MKMISRALAALGISAGAIAASMGGNVEAQSRLNLMIDKLMGMYNRQRRSAGLTRSYRSRAHAKWMPHVGKRQIARNTRQLAAEQIAFIQHGPKVVEVVPVKKARKSRAKAVTA